MGFTLKSRGFVGPEALGESASRSLSSARFAVSRLRQRNRFAAPSPIPFLSVLIFSLLSCGPSFARWPHHRTQGTPPPGRPRCIPHTHDRAGAPLALSAHAAPSITPHAQGYYVGGGTPLHGDARHWHEGTWGWDDTGTLCPRLVRLRWLHGRHAQGGTGAYATDRSR
jgi:hypothetical protein